ncbi:MAG: hypothetical protein RLO51_19690 [Thalassobaculum sp.]|uniref:hypothetical protein n=1 Tax=Thalassobaculum sp. TaxID=2022740 RepID=UPI0032EADEBC
MAAPPRHAACRVSRALAALCLMAVAAACQSVPETVREMPVRAAPRHPIQTSEPWVATPVARSESGDASPVTPGPNSRTSRTPDMAPRREPADRVETPSPMDQLDDIRRDLQQQRERDRQKTDPPKGTIKRPGTIKPPGTIDVPR